MYKVESVAMPEAKGKRNVYPFKTMEVGESFLVESSPENMTKTQRKMSALCSMSGKRQGKIFVTRRVENGIRIFRIEEVKS
jgi:hypothetical protein